MWSCDESAEQLHESSPSPQPIDLRAAARGKRIEILIVT